MPEDLESFENIYLALVRHKDSLLTIFEYEVDFEDNFIFDWKAVDDSSFEVDLDLMEFFIIRVVCCH